MNVYSDNLTYAAVTSTLSATASIHLSTQNVFTVDLSSYLTTACAASAYGPILTWANPGNFAIPLIFNNIIPAKTKLFR